MVHSLQNTSPGAGLPDFIRERMIFLKMRPSLTQLAAKAGVPKMTLQQNLSGVQAMRLSTAIKIAEALEVSIDELVEKCGLE